MHERINRLRCPLARDEVLGWESKLINMFLVSDNQEGSKHVCTGIFVAARRLVIVVSCLLSFQFALKRCRTTSSRTRSVTSIATEMRSMAHAGGSHTSSASSGSPTRSSPTCGCRRTNAQCALRRTPDVAHVHVVASNGAATARAASTARRRGGGELERARRSELGELGGSQTEWNED